MQQSGYRHSMLREIYQQPEVLHRCLEQFPFPLPNLPLLQENPPETIHILACGSSRHAALVGQYWLEQLAGIPTRVRSAAEFPLMPLPPTPRTLTIVVTQSGETADTLAAVRFEQARRSALPIPFQPWFLGLTNQADSTLTQLIPSTLVTEAGREQGVAATKTFTAQILVFFSLALSLGWQRQTLSLAEAEALWAEGQRIPEQMAALLEAVAPAAVQMADRLLLASSAMVLGQGMNTPIAREGALKLKETTYLPTEGYGIGEFMHGPIALLDERVPVIAIVPSAPTLTSFQPRLEKIRSYGSPVLGIGLPAAAALVDHLLPLPTVNELLSPLLTVVPLQLLAYHLADRKGFDVDHPRHLTKAIV